MISLPQPRQTNAHDQSISLAAHASRNRVLLMATTGAAEYRQSVWEQCIDTVLLTGQTAYTLLCAYLPHYQLESILSCITCIFQLTFLLLTHCCCCAD